MAMENTHLLDHHHSRGEYKLTMRDQLVTVFIISLKYIKGENFKYEETRALV